MVSSQSVVSQLKDRFLISIFLYFFRLSHLNQTFQTVCTLQSPSTCSSCRISLYLPKTSSQMAILLGITQKGLLCLVLPAPGAGNMQTTFSKRKEQNSRQMVCGTKGDQEMFALWKFCLLYIQHIDICVDTHIYTPTYRQT